MERVKTILLAILLVSTAFGQNLSFANNGSLTIFPINPGSRGADIVSMFNLLNNANSIYKLSSSQIALQTTRNGLITNVQFIIPMANSTILVVGYLMPDNRTPPGVAGGIPQPIPAGLTATASRYGYIALPVEQIVEMVYSPIMMQSSFIFTSTVLGGTLPLFSVDLAQRAADIIQAVNLLNTPPIANPGTSNASPPVSMLTTVNGPYYGVTNPSSQLIVNGKIPRIVSITPVSPNGTLLLVQFKPLVTNNNLLQGEIATIVIAPDQVNEIQFSQQ